MLTCVHKKQRMVLALTYLQQYHKDGDEFLSHIVWVTGDETWVSLWMLTPRCSPSKQWMHTHSPNKLKKSKQNLSAIKLMTTVFWNRKRALMVKFTQQGTTMTTACGLVVRVSGYRSRGPGFDSQSYQIFWEVGGLERGPLSLVRTTDELLEWKSSSSALKNRD
jgi:hypothetical protein